MPTRRVRYKTNNGNVFYVECDDDSSIDAILGAQPTEAPTEEMTCKIQKNTRKFGISPRYSLFARLVGTQGENAAGLVTYGRQYKEVPSLTKQAWDGVITGKIGDTGVTQITHRGETYYAVRKIDEDID